MFFGERAAASTAQDFDVSSTLTSLGMERLGANEPRCEWEIRGAYFNVSL